LNRRSAEGAEDKPGGLNHRGTARAANAEARWARGWGGGEPADRCGLRLHPGQANARNGFGWRGRSTRLWPIAWPFPFR